MAFWHIINTYGTYVTIFLILENVMMLFLIITSTIHYFKVRKLERIFNSKND